MTFSDDDSDLIAALQIELQQHSLSNDSDRVQGFLAKVSKADGVRYTRWQMLPTKWMQKMLEKLTKETPVCKD